MRSAGVPVDVQVEGAARPLPLGVELTAYRVIQEALTNVLKHAVGATARVTVSYTDTTVRLLVEDDGGDAAGPREDRAGLGLNGIRERVALYGGLVEAGPVTPRGYRLGVSLPLSSVNAS